MEFPNELGGSTFHANGARESILESATEGEGVGRWEERADDEGPRTAEPPGQPVESVRLPEEPRRQAASRPDAVDHDDVLPPRPDLQ